MSGLSPEQGARFELNLLVPTTAPTYRVRVHLQDGLYEAKAELDPTTFQFSLTEETCQTPLLDWQSKYLRALLRQIAREVEHSEGQRGPWPRRVLRWREPTLPPCPKPENTLPK